MFSHLMYDSTGLVKKNYNGPIWLLMRPRPFQTTRVVLAEIFESQLRCFRQKQFLREIVPNMSVKPMCDISLDISQLE